MQHQQRKLLGQYGLILVIVVAIVVFALLFLRPTVSQVYSHCGSPPPSGMVCI